MSSISLRGSKRTRPLGSLRRMLTPDDSKLQIPKLNITPKAQEDEKLDEHYSGIQGNAMTLPSPKETSRTDERRKSMPVIHKESNQPKSSSASSNSAVSHEACEKELKEVLVSM